MKGIILLIYYIGLIGFKTTNIVLHNVLLIIEHWFVFDGGTNY